MQFCEEILIPKTEKTKFMRTLYKKTSGLMSNIEKQELMNYFSQMSDFDEHDEVRKRKFEMEFSFLKIMKAFIQKQRSYVKQGNLQSSNMKNEKERIRERKKEAFSEKNEDFIMKSEENEEVFIKKRGKKRRNSEKDENYKKFMRKLQSLKNEDPEKFLDLSRKFHRTKEKCEKNLQNIQ